MIALLRNWTCTLLLAAIAPSVLADPVAESDVKAAFVFNFIAFTEWPGDANRETGPIVVCVAASNPLRATLATLDGRTVKSRRFQTRAQTTPDDLDACHVVIVDAESRARIPSILRAIGTRPILTIGEGPDLQRDGLAVSVFVEQSRLRFRVNLHVAKAAQLEISSKLLRLAQSVD